jgi:hypothetical protein
MSSRAQTPLVGAPLGLGWWPSSPAPSFAPANPQACPLMPLVGACCSGCAEGHGCDASAKLEAAAQNGALPRVGETGYPWAEAVEFNGEVQKLNVAMAGAGPSLQIQWTGFYAGWQQWYAEHDQNFHYFGMTGETVVEFDEYRKTYNVLLEKAVTGGLATTAKPIDFKSPVERGLESAGEGLGEGLGKIGSAATDALAGVAGAVTTGLAWVAIAGGVGLVLYFGVPILVTRLAR